MATVVSSLRFKQNDINLPLKLWQWTLRDEATIQWAELKLSRVLHVVFTAQSSPELCSWICTAIRFLQSYSISYSVDSTCSLMLVSLLPSKQEQMLLHCVQTETCRRTFSPGLWSCFTKHAFMFVCSRRLLIWPQLCFLMLRSGQVGNGTFSQSCLDVINL